MIIKDEEGRVDRIECDGTGCKQQVTHDFSASTADEDRLTFLESRAFRRSWYLCGDEQHLCEACISKEFDGG